MSQMKNCDHQHLQSSVGWVDHYTLVNGTSLDYHCVLGIMIHLISTVISYIACGGNLHGFPRFAIYNHNVL